jgi:tRNA dimethylallyltransferase
VKSKKLIVIQGPTASGKTALAIALAKQFETVIFSADSRQFFKEMSVGTAKPTLEEQAGIKHYFIDSHSVQDPVSAADFEKEALAHLEQEFKQHEYIILVGGSGMFIDALCDGLDDIPNDENLRNELSLQVKNEGLSKLLMELKEKDVSYYDLVDKQNANRIIRAIEAIRLTGQPFSSLRKAQKKERFFEINRYVINLPREVLYERINLRAAQMFENNLIEEVKNLSPFRDLQSLNTVGYKEVFEYLDGKVSLEQAIEQVQQNSRRYAKRQLTWFRRNETNFWLKSQSTQEQEKEILQNLGILP